MHIIQMAQEQHAIYFGYAFLGVLGRNFYRNCKWLNIHQALHAVCGQFWNFSQMHAYFTAYKIYNMLCMIVHI